MDEQREGAEREFHFSDENFRTLSRIANEHSGIVLGEAKRHMVYSRLTRRLRQLKLRSFDAYIERLQAGDEREFTEFINAITTNLTSFFREPHHFEHLRSEALPEVMHRHASDRRIRIWSAGCSTGEEPYSIAITMRETVPITAGWDARILATDLDTNVLARGSAGVYEEDRIASLPSERVKRWFRRGTGDNDGLVRVDPDLQELITFRQLNLIQPLPMRGPFDIIFCRNVVIYFDKPTQRMLFDRYANLLADRGYLYIGHSETLYKVSDRFESLGRTIYQKTR
jgi:chemotaxis protein methyltransferase CheR